MGQAGTIPEDGLMRLRVAADRIGISHHGLRRAIHRGELSCYSIGRVFYVKEKDLGLFLEACRQEPLPKSS
jgi:predicted site-specific integrase-resolvase